jgi:imidazolonepropionase-like amidohydrolase
LSYLRYSIRSSLSIPNLLKLVKALQDAGALILLGTDEGSLPGAFPGTSVHQELALFVEAGLTPYQALQTATKNSGEFVNKRIDADDRFGTVTAGSRADLLLLQNNPLENVGHASTPLGVMVRGRWLSHSELRSMRDAAVKVFRLGPPAAVTAN